MKKNDLSRGPQHRNSEQMIEKVIDSIALVSLQAQIERRYLRLTLNAGSRSRQILRQDLHLVPLRGTH